MAEASGKKKRVRKKKTTKKKVSKVAEAILKRKRDDAAGQRVLVADAVKRAGEEDPNEALNAEKEAAARALRADPVCHRNTHKWVLARMKDTEETGAAMRCRVCDLGRTPVKYQGGQPKHSILPARTEDLPPRNVEAEK